MGTKPGNRAKTCKASIEPVRILLVNESRIACQSLKGSLERTCRKARIVGCAVNYAEAITSLSHGNVDVALVNDDLQDGQQSFEKVLRAIHRNCPNAKLVALLKNADAASVVGAFRGGVRGVFHRSETVEGLCKCARAVHEGQIWANTQDLCHLLDALDLPVQPDFLNPPDISLLTKRENQTARLVAEGHSNRAIAEKLGLTEHTVSNYLFRIYNKLGISSRVELVLYSFNQKREE